MGQKREPEVRAVSRHIVLQGAYGNGNSGDDAILLSVWGQLAQAVDGATFRVISLAPSLTERLLDGKARVYSAPWSSARGFLRNISLMAWADLYVFGGGGLLSEQRQGIMVGLGLRLLFAKLCRTKTMICAVGVNPLRSSRAKRLARTVIALADCATVRDEFSLECLAEAGVPPGRVQVTADPAFALEAAPREDVWRILADEVIQLSDRPLLGLSVAHSLAPEGRDLLAEAIRQLVDAGLDVILLPFERFTDLPVTEDLLSRVGETRRVHCVRSELNPRQLKALVGQLDLLVSMRLHPLIFAVDQGVPAVAISFVPKTAALMQRVGQRDRVLYLDYMARSGHVPVLGVEPLLACVMGAMASSAEIKSGLLERRAGLRQLAALNAQLAANLLSRPAHHVGRQGAI